MMTENISKKVFWFQAGNGELLQAFVYSENCFQAFLDRWVFKYSTYVYICLPVSGIQNNRYTLALLLSQLWFRHECGDLDYKWRKYYYFGKSAYAGGITC